MAKSLRGRCMEVQSKTQFLDADLIPHCLQELESNHGLMRWQWVIHDKDVDEKTNTPKDEHVHIALEFGSAKSYSTVAKVFGIDVRFVRKPKAKYNQFLVMARYQTHESETEQAKGKYRYPDSEIHANFDFRSAVDSMDSGRELNRSEVNQLLLSVRNGSITLDELKDKYGFVTYVRNQKVFDTARKEYIRKDYKIGMRFNYYVYGHWMDNGRGGRIGKSALCKLIARSLYPGLTAEECYYVVGSAAVGFQNYEGQPVVIWDDARPGQMVSTFGRTELLNMFDDNPSKSSVNVKYGDKYPIQTYNIINSIMPYDDFARGLAGEYTDARGVQHKAEDINQIHGRFAGLVEVTDLFIKLMLNQEWLRATPEFSNFVECVRISGNFAKLMRGYDGDARDALVLDEYVSPIKTKMLEHQAEREEKITDPALIRPEDRPVVTIGYEACAELQEREEIMQEIEEANAIEAARYEEMRRMEEMRDVLAEAGIIKTNYPMTINGF